MRQSITAFLRNQNGTTAIEYGLIAALVVMVIITALSLLGNNMQHTLYSGIAAL